MNNPILYILMRTDLPSMNGGKAMAQASHASNAFVQRATRGVLTEKLDKGVEQWKNSTPQGFGTVLVLAATGPEIDAAMEALRLREAIYDRVVDPSYPYRADVELASLIPTSLDTIPRQVNGTQVTLWRKEVTCAYIFGDKEELADIVGCFKLHP